jgi:hypothetical protein
MDSVNLCSVPQNRFTWGKFRTFLDWQVRKTHPKRFCILQGAEALVNIVPTLVLELLEYLGTT